jgi:hypothetical protein
MEMGLSKPNENGVFAQARGEPSKEGDISRPDAIRRLAELGLLKGDQ